MRPLDFARSIKLKLGLVIVAAVAVTVVVVSLGDRAGLSPLITGVVAAVLALAMVQVLAHGMTSPLREMVAAARAMARGKYDRRVTATSRDEVGELARAFNTMAAELAEVDRLRRDIVANVSHELRTPLGALRAKLENLVDEVERADRATLRAMLTQVERLGDLVSQLLDLSKLESGAVPLERSTFSAAALLAQVADEWRTRAEIRDIRVETQVASEPLALDGDETRLRQVFSNLVANAVRHSPRGGLVLLRAEGGNGTVRLEVVDEGPGIPAGESERVFERFYRSDGARSAAEGGSGLGLAIARWIVDLHGGRIWVATEQQEGCRLVVELPR
ncbi:MAG TPA: ATP-binding protein [Gaiellaceae bacterium]|nr:ATP-binding protein [Gaiellaceae bacterium]